MVNLGFTSIIIIIITIVIVAVVMAAHLAIYKSLGLGEISKVSIKWHYCTIVCLPPNWILREI